jgi:hypothetical protein
MPVLQYISTKWPFWNATGGSRHIIPMEGVIMNAMCSSDWAHGLFRASPVCWWNMSPLGLSCAYFILSALLHLSAVASLHPFLLFCYHFASPLTVLVNTWFIHTLMMPCPRWCWDLWTSSPGPEVHTQRDLASILGHVWLSSELGTHIPQPHPLLCCRQGEWCRSYQMVMIPHRSRSRWVLILLPWFLYKNGSVIIDL